MISTTFASFDSQIDSIDGFEGNIAVSLSNLEGNQWDGYIIVLNDKSKELATLETGFGASSLRYLNSGMQLLAGRDDGNLVLYTNLLEEVRKFPAHDGIVSAISISDSSYSQFASVGWDGGLVVFDWRVNDSNSPIYSADSHSGQAYDLCYNNFDNTIATVGKDGFSRTWDIRSSSSDCVNIFELGQIGTSITWIPGQQHKLLIGLEDGRLLLFDQRKPHLPVQMIHNTVGSIRRLRSTAAMDGTGPTIVSMSEDCSVSLFSYNDGSLMEVNEDMNEVSAGLVESHRFTAHTDYVSDAVWFDFSSETGAAGRSLLTSSWDKKILRSDFNKNAGNEESVRVEVDM